jgi:predicted nucleotidyltransferase
VFGAQAVAVRGAPRATRDLDITVEVDRGRLAALAAALGAFLS